jgi:hypothetical protein
MRRLLAEVPRGINCDVIGELTRTTVNKSENCEPFAFEPHRPYYCPVCGEDMEKVEPKVSTIVTLEFSNAEALDLITWAHPACIETCRETREPDRDLE